MKAPALSQLLPPCQGHNTAFKKNLVVFRLLEVSIPEKVGDGEEYEEGSDVETPEEQPVDLVVQHLRPKSIFELTCSYFLICNFLGRIVLI